ncbi:MAG TPA: SDR family oxidoreductase [Burkholderiaceae bacterium]|nr:SDR family oxidoreductase [Burkholderiaceae bacterium]
MSMSKTVVITGTTRGIGRVTAEELAAAGYRVITLVRDLAAGLTVREAIVAAAPKSRLDVVHCDLGSLASVRQAAGLVRRETLTIDCLINNAGIVSLRRATSVDGFELVFATNHLGPFLLTELLLDRIARGGRIINVASRIHFKGSLDLAQVVAPTQSSYGPRAAYAQSKLANVLHTFALARRLAGRGIAVNCLHPGVVRSGLLPPWIRTIKPLISPEMADVTRGARTTLYLALDAAAGALNGMYLDENQKVRPAAPLAQSIALQEALWAASMAWVDEAGSPASARTGHEPSEAGMWRRTDEQRDVTDSPS